MKFIDSKKGAPEARLGRDGNKPDKSPSPPSPSPQWFRLETNFDHWSIITDGRRAPANAHMKAIGQDSISLSRIFTEVLSIKPVLASDTVYTTLMWPATNSYQSIIRPGY